MNILIVDDDTLIRNWLSMLLTQLKQYEITLFEASDGIEALEICAASPIDLLITDIKMPQMNGIDLINRLKTEHSQIRTSVLSSYDDFDYVRIALKCGALDYILKAEMKLEDISSLLEKTLNDIKLETSLQHGFQSHYSTISETKKNFTNYLENESISSEQFLSAINPPLTINYLCIAIFKTGENNVIDIPVFVVSDICNNTMRGENIKGVAFPWDKDYFVLMYNCTDTISEHQKSEYLKLLSLMDKNLEKYLNIPISFSINLICKKDDALRSKFTNALDIMGYRQYYSQSANLEKSISEQHSGRKELIRSIQKLLDIGDHEQAVTVLLGHLVYVHSIFLAPKKVKSTITAAMNIFLTHVTLLDSKSVLAESMEGFLDDIISATTAENMQDKAEQFCKAYLEQVQTINQNISNVIKLAVEYINENYSKKIILDHVAAHVFLNRSYLSQLFKKEMGISFGNYLERVRIDKAKELIRSSNKTMSEIAELVGFSNQNYFTKVFKKVMGVSPMRYKKY